MAVAASKRDIPSGGVAFYMGVVGHEQIENNGGVTMWIASKQQVPG